MAKSADAKDLKSFVPNGTCGFNSRPGHESVRLPEVFESLLGLESLYLPRELSIRVPGYVFRPRVQGGGVEGMGVSCRVRTSPWSSFAGRALPFRLLRRRRVTSLNRHFVSMLCG